MVTILAEQAIQIKCGFPGATMTGNFECAYTLGLFCAYLKMDISAPENVDGCKEIQKQILEKIDTDKIEDERVKKLAGMLKEYEIEDVFQPEMISLFQDGMHHKI